MRRRVGDRGLIESGIYFHLDGSENNPIRQTLTLRPHGSESVLQLSLYSLAHRFDERRDYRSNHWR
jgi:hypothetical protein